MNTRHVISAEAKVRAAQVKPQGGRSQNYMPPEASHAVSEAMKGHEVQGAK